MEARDLMTPDPACCAPNTPLTEVAKMMCDHDCGEIPIVEHGKPVGVVTDRDIVCRVIAHGKNALNLAAKDCMSSPTITVTTETSIEDCCDVLEQYQIRRVPIVDGRGEIRGIISQADIARRAPDSIAAAVVREVSQPTGWASAV